VITTTQESIGAFHQLEMATGSGSTGSAKQFAASNIDIFERQGMSAGEAISTFQSTKAVKGYNYGDLWALEGSLHGYGDGGPVTQTGPALVHDGEYVIPKDGALVSGGGGGSDMPQIIQLILDGKIVAQVVNDQTMNQQKLRSKYRAA
jgi:hypothetical protein